MLSSIEREIAERIYHHTENWDYVVFAITLRRLFPQLQMNAVDLAGIIFQVDLSVIELAEGDRE